MTPPSTFLTNSLAFLSLSQAEPVRTACSLVSYILIYTHDVEWSCTAGRPRKVEPNVSVRNVAIQVNYLVRHGPHNPGPGTWGELSATVRFKDVTMQCVLNHPS